MSVLSLPPGTDVLRARQAEMRGHDHARLSRSPEQSWETLRALATRLAAVGAAVSAPGQLGAAAASLAGDRVGSGELHLSMDWPWRAMAALVTYLPIVEQRLNALDGKAPSTDGLLLDAMAGQVALDGFVHRHPENFHTALELLVHHVLEAETRAAAPTPTTT